jgi:hypothetical protein
MAGGMYYALRSKKDGQYIAARPDIDRPDRKYLLVFREDYDALSYLSTHAKELAVHFGTEHLTTDQLKTAIERWSYEGVGLVSDSLLPQVDFMAKRFL